METLRTVLQWTVPGILLLTSLWGALKHQCHKGPFCFFKQISMTITLLAVISTVVLMISLFFYWLYATKGSS